MADVSRRDAFRFWVRLGFINFGGPAGQIAIMHRELVETRRWITEAQFLRSLNLCMLMPGPEAQQLATYVGWRLHGTLGGIVAGTMFVLPSVFVLLALSWLVAVHGSEPRIEAALFGVQAVVVGIVGEAVLRIGRRVLHNRVLVLFAAAAFLAMYAAGLPFPLVIAAAALAGVIVWRRSPSLVSRPVPEASPAHDDSHAATPHGHIVPVVLAFLALWGIPVAALLALAGPGHVLSQVALFFTGAAFVTFGGAYAVLAYIADAAVNVFGWLDASQMVTGLGLAESTPGPLIMVTQYVGFFAGFGDGDLALGVAAALLATYVTFLPSFLFILALAPYAERIVHAPRLQAAMTGITAAVVGVILNLAAFFGERVLLRAGAPDPFAIGLAAVSAVLLWRWRVPLPVVVALGLAAGLAWTVSGALAP